MGVFAFDEFELDTERFELRRSGQPVALEPQVFRLLVALVENRDRLLSKDDILDLIWQGRIVSEAALSSRIKSARQALGDDGESQKFIRTIRGQGFRFVGTLREETPEAKPDAAPLLADVGSVMARPLVGVFPFAFDLPDAEYLVDGLAERLIAELATWRWFPVVSRHAAFACARNPQAVAQRAAELGVRYAITGRVWSREGAVRLTIELSDFGTSETLWSDMFEGDFAGLIPLQAEIAATIVRKITPEMEAAERRRIIRSGEDNLTAWDLTLKALWALNQPSQGQIAQAAQQLESAIRLDPGAPLPWSLMAQAQFEIGLDGWLDGDVARARGCFAAMLDAARKAVELDPSGWLGHSLASAGELWSASCYPRARQHAEQALRLNPSAGLAQHISGCIVGFGGDPAEAVAIQQQVYSVDPDYAHATVIEADLGLWQFLLGDFDRADAHLQAALEQEPRNVRALQRLIAVRARLGDPDGAAEACRKLADAGSAPSMTYLAASYPFQDSAHLDMFREALLLGGVPPAGS